MYHGLLYSDNTAFMKYYVVCGHALSIRAFVVVLSATVTV